MGVPRFDDASAAAVAAWSLRHEIACAYLLVSLGDQAAIAAAAAAGFRFVDVRVTLDRASGTLAAPAPSRDGVVLRPSRADDVGALREIARISHRDSRFYFDLGFPREKCDELYATWVERSHAGFADALFVAEVDSQPAGYFSCHLDDAATGRIGLVAVEPRSQGQRLGPRLVNCGLRWFAAQKVRRIIVATQARNVPALRLYEGADFKVVKVEVWFHKWFVDAR